MRHRPWPILILSFLHFLAPFGNIALSAWLQSTSLLTYLEIFFKTATPKDYLELFFLLPLAGLGIYFVKGWSFIVYLVAMSWVFVQNYLTFKSQGAQFPLPLFIFLFAVNIAIVSYFFIPQVRNAYFDKRHRWWESKPRYRVQLFGKLFSESSTSTCRISNISEGGAFIESACDVKIHEKIKVHFSLLQIEFVCEGTIVHVRDKIASIHGYGVKFSDEKVVRHLIEALKILGVSSRGDHFSMLHDFVDWAKHAVSDKNAWVPNLEPIAAEKPASEINQTPPSVTNSESQFISVIEASEPKMRLVPEVESEVPAVYEEKPVLFTSGVVAVTQDRPSHWPDGIPVITNVFAEDLKKVA